VFCQEFLSGVRLEERFAVVAAEQEGEAVQIAAELVKALGGRPLYAWSEAASGRGHW